MKQFILSAAACILVALVNGIANCDQSEGISSGQEAVLRGIARGISTPWIEITPDQAEQVHEKALEFQRLAEEHMMPHGLIADVWWTDESRRSPYRYEGVGDSAANTGYYLSTLALRYHVEKDEKLLSRIHAVLDKYDLLTRISGREGYIARYAGPVDSKPFQQYYGVYGGGEDPERPGFGKRAYRGVAPWEDLVWLGWSSRDMYDGVGTALATTWRYVDDEDVQAKIKMLVERIGVRWIADEYWIVDGKENQTKPAAQFKLTWQCLLLGICPETFADLRGEYQESATKLIEKGVTVSPMTYQEYFANNLRYNRMFVLCTIEQDPKIREGYQSVLKRMYKGQTNHHLNAYFAAIYMLCTGETTDNDARATYQGLMIDFPSAPKFLRMVDHSDDLTTEPHPDEAYAAKYTRYAQLVSERVPSDFQWQRSPLVRAGGQDVSLEYPGLDVTVPYWMGRVAEFMPAP